MDLWLEHDFHFICRVFLRPISDNLTRHARLRRREIGERDCQYLPEKKLTRRKLKAPPCISSRRLIFRLKVCEASLKGIKRIHMYVHMYRTGKWKKDEV